MATDRELAARSMMQAGIGSLSGRPQHTAFRNYHPSSPGATPTTPWMVKENQDIQDLYVEGLQDIQDLYVEGARRDTEGDYSNRQPGFGVGNLRTVRPPLNPLNPFVNPRGMRRGIETLDNYYLMDNFPETLRAEASGDTFDAMRHQLRLIGIDPTGMGDDEIRQIYDINIGGTTGGEDQFGVAKIDPWDWRNLDTIIKAGENPDDYVKPSNRGGLMSLV